MKLKPTIMFTLAMSLMTSCVNFADDKSIDPFLQSHSAVNAAVHANTMSAPHPVVDLAALKAINAGGAR